MILALGGIGLASCSTNERPHDMPEAQKEFKYELYEDIWNKDVADLKLAESFRLYGDRGGSDANVIAALNDWLLAFSEPAEGKYLAELEELGKESGVTSFHAWEDFRREHRRQNKLALDLEMDPHELWKAVNNYIGVARAQNHQDYISPETVRTIAGMNDICAFFEAEKDRLHKEGIDTDIHKCHDLSPGEHFPTLEKLLNTAR